MHSELLSGLIGLAASALTVWGLAVWISWRQEKGGRWHL